MKGPCILIQEVFIEVFRNLCIVRRPFPHLLGLRKAKRTFLLTEIVLVLVPA